MQENADQNNSEYGQFLRSVNQDLSLIGKSLPESDIDFEIESEDGLDYAHTVMSLMSLKLLKTIIC